MMIPRKVISECRFRGLSFTFHSAFFKVVLEFFKPIYCSRSCSRCINYRRHGRREKKLTIEKNGNVISSLNQERIHVEISSSKSFIVYLFQSRLCGLFLQSSTLFFPLGRQTSLFFLWFLFDDWRHEWELNHPVLGLEHLWVLKSREFLHVVMSNISVVDNKGLIKCGAENSSWFLLVHGSRMNAQTPLPFVVSRLSNINGCPRFTSDCAVVIFMGKVGYFICMSLSMYSLAATPPYDILDVCYHSNQKVKISSIGWSKCMQFILPFGTWRSLSFFFVEIFQVSLPLGMLQMNLSSRDRDNVWKIMTGWKDDTILRSVGSIGVQAEEWVDSIGDRGYLVGLE